MNGHSKKFTELFQSPVKLTLILLMAAVFLEIIIILFFDRFPEISVAVKIWINLAYLVLIFLPILYFFVFRPLKIYRQNLAESEAIHKNAREFTENLIQTANVIAVGLDISGNIMIFNKTAEKITGYTFEELKGKNWFDIFVPESDQQGVRNEFSQLTKNGTKISSYENPILTKTGEERYISWQNSILTENGIEKGTLSFGIDNTERQRAELVEKVRYEITQGVTRTSNLGELLQLIHGSLKQVLYAENCFFALYDHETGLYSFPFFVDKFDSAPEPVAMAKSCSAYVFRSGRSQIINIDAFNKLLELNEVELVGSSSPSWIGIPLKTSERTIGVMVLQHYEKENVYNDAHLHLLDSIASEVANVIERKRAEADLEKSISLLSATLESTADGILVVDKNGKTANYNNRFKEMWRIPQTLLETKNDEVMLSFVLDQLKDPEIFLKKVKELYENCEAESFDILEFKDGRTFQRYSKPQIFEGESVGRVWSFHDISELKKFENILRESEKKFRTFFEKSPIGIEIYDSNGVQTDVNRAALEIFGIKDKNESLGFNIFEGTSLDEDLKNRLQSGIPVEYQATFNFTKVIELNQYHSSRKGVADLKYSITPLKSKNNTTIVGYLLLVQDISEQVQNEKVLKENEARLLELNATKDKFFSIISHDLRSPFNGILGFSDILVTKAEQNEYQGMTEYARIIHNSSLKAMELLTNLLEWSRAQTGRIEFSPEYIEFVSVVNEVTDLVSDSALQKSIAIEKRLPHSLPFVADRYMISAVMRNLLTNAIKFTNPGGKVTVSAELSGTDVLVSVADNGIGISQSDLKDMFRIDKNISKAGTLNEHGTGLGLMLCKEFIDKHDGKIWAESEIGKGSRFSFSIAKKNL